MRKLMILISMALGCSLIWGITLKAQSAKLADWLTDGGDIERTAWQRNETIFPRPASKT